MIHHTVLVVCLSRSALSVSSSSEMTISLWAVLLLTVLMELWLLNVLNFLR